MWAGEKNQALTRDENQTSASLLPAGPIRILVLGTITDFASSLYIKVFAGPSTVWICWLEPPFQQWVSEARISKSDTYGHIAIYSLGFAGTFAGS